MNATRNLNNKREVQAPALSEEVRLMTVNIWKNKYAIYVERPFPPISDAFGDIMYATAVIGVMY